MKLRKEIFDIITIEPGEKEYFPFQEDIDSLKEYWEEEELAGKCVYTTIEIPLGHSRYGGPVIDIPKDGAFPLEKSIFDHPTHELSVDGFAANYMRFVAQLDLSKVSSFDKNELLPKTGQLYFFADIYNEKCHVFHINVRNEDLKRIVVKHRDNFYSGRLIKNITAAQESFEDHLRPLEEDELECFECGNDFRTCACHSEYQEYQKDDLTENGKVWDAFIGGEKSKIFGIFTEYQASSMQEIEEMTYSEDLLLLQIGENGFNDEGVFYVSISLDDLKEKRFENCKCRWSQT